MTHIFYSTWNGYFMNSYVEVEAESVMDAAAAIAAKTKGVVVEESMWLEVRTESGAGWAYHLSQQVWDGASRVEFDDLRPPAPLPWDDRRV